MVWLRTSASHSGGEAGVRGATQRRGEEMTRSIASWGPGDTAYLPQLENRGVSFVWGPGSPGGGSSSSLQARARSPRSETGRMRSPARGGARRRAAPRGCGEAGRVRGRVRGRGSSYSVYESVRKRVSSPREYPRARRHDSRVPSRAHTPTPDDASARRAAFQRWHFSAFQVAGKTWLSRQTMHTRAAHRR